MPPTADTSGDAPATGTPAPRAAASLRMPERDNPFLWRAKSKEGRRGALRLLELLTDEEVSRYMDMASDQVRAEEQRIGLQVLAVMTALGLVAYDMADGLQHGITGWHLAGLLLAAGLGYWPWRVRACRRLWMKHLTAAKAELAKRRAASERPGTGR